MTKIAAANCRHCLITAKVQSDSIRLHQILLLFTTARTIVEIARYRGKIQSLTPKVTSQLPASQTKHTDRQTNALCMLYKLAKGTTEKY